MSDHSSRLNAEHPTTPDLLQYHTHTRPGDLAELCLIVGAQGRAQMIAHSFLESPKFFANPHRGLVSATGKYHGLRVSVTTSGMGGASTAIVLPEAVRSGARMFIRVGSCGSLIPEAAPGDAVITTAAIRFDGASNNWAPPEFPAVAHWKVVSALVQAAAAHQGSGKAYVGVECTTDDFYAGQGRPDLWNEVPERAAKRHEEVLRLGAASYSMEAATLFVWCATQGRGLPAGAISAVFANRHTKAWGTLGEERASVIALDALLLLSQDRKFMEELGNTQIPELLS